MENTNESNQNISYILDQNNISSFDQNNVCSFDLIYSKAPTNFANIVNYFQYRANGIGGEYSHVALCLKGDLFPYGTTFEYNNEHYKIDKDKMYLFESDRRTEGIGKNIFGKYHDGVQLREFDMVVKNCFDNKHLCSSLAYSKMNEKYKSKLNEYFDNELNKLKFAQYIKDSLKLIYNQNTVDHINIVYHDYTIMKAVKYVNDLMYNNESSIVCSELVGMTLSHIGFMNENTKFKHLLPEDFLPKNDDEVCGRDKNINVMFDNIVKIY